MKTAVMVFAVLWIALMASVGQALELRDALNLLKSSSYKQCRFEVKPVALEPTVDAEIQVWRRGTLVASTQAKNLPRTFKTSWLDENKVGLLSFVGGTTTSQFDMGIEFSEGRTKVVYLRLGASAYLADAPPPFVIKYDETSFGKGCEQ